MAEVVAVIGIIASVLDIIDGVDKYQRIWRTYFHMASSLRKELLPILGKLRALGGILRGIQLQIELDEADADRLIILNHIEQPLKASEQAVRLISTRLEQLASKGDASWTFGKVLNKDVTAAVRILDEARPVLDLALAADQRTLVKAIETYVRNIAEDLRDATSKNTLYYEDLKAHLAETKSADNDAFREKKKTQVLEWISEVNYSINYHAARQPTQQSDASGNWFLTSQECREWISGAGHPRLLLTGISGSGKTVLCAKAIEHLARTKAAAGEGVKVLYYFFDFNDAAKQTVEGMVRALCCQFLKTLTQLPEDVLSFYETQQSPTADKSSLTDWLTLLSSLLNDEKETFVFIDALDECIEAESGGLLQDALQKILAATTNSVHWCFTCRPDQKAADNLRAVGFGHVEMRPELVDHDIETYLSTAFEVDPKLTSFSKDAKECITTEIKAKSHGMFRYAQCQLDAIAKLRDRRMRKVKDILSIMPRSIFESYSRILQEAQLLDDWPIVTRILLLVSCSARPVTVGEVGDFAIVEDGMRDVTSDDRFDIHETLAGINSLINVRDGIVSLAHKSVNDFLTDGAVPQSLAGLLQHSDLHIALTCFQYLRISQPAISDLPEARKMKEPNTSQLKKLLEAYPFLDYAAARWPYHLQDQHVQDSALAAMVAALPLGCESNLWHAWLLLQRAEIWDNQVQLARIMTEAFIRGSRVSDWADRFWEERQAYRVWTGAKSVKRKPNFGFGASTLSSTVDESIPTQMPETHYWATAVTAQATDPMPYNLDEANPLKFGQGDRIFIHSALDQKTLWGCFDGKFGSVPVDKVTRRETTIRTPIAGQAFHTLAILLLEIASQASLAPEASRVFAQVRSEDDLTRYLAQLRKWTADQVVGTMGQQYARIITSCLEYVYWSDGDDIPKTDDDKRSFSDLCNHQEHAIQMTCEPLEAMLASGFRASTRRTIKRVARIAALVPAGTRFDTSAPYYNIPPPDIVARTSASVTYGFVRNGSVPPYAINRAMSAGPAWTGNATVLSQSAAYWTSPTPSLPYRPSSTSAAMMTYSTSSTYMVAASPAPSSQQISSGLAGRLSSPAQAVDPGSQHSPLAPLETVSEANNEEDINVEAIDSETINPESKVIGPKVADIIMKARSDAIDVDVDMSRLVWQYPDQLTYAAFRDAEQFPGYVTPSNDMMRRRIEASHAAVLTCDDEQLQLLWARDALLYARTAENNSRLTATALGASASYESDLAPHIRQAAMWFVRTMAERGHAEAIFEEGFWYEFGTVDVERDLRKSYGCYSSAAEKGYERARYRMGLMFENSDNRLKALSLYNQAADAQDSAGLYRIGMITLLGQFGQEQDHSRGLQLLYRSAEVADQNYPHALYVLGMLSLHKLHQLDFMYDRVPYDESGGVMYLERAAYFEAPKAQLELAKAYEFADFGLQYSLSMALHYYILAARQGEAEAEMGLSKIMLANQADERAAEIAYVYARRAASSDLPVAMFAVGYYHEKGIGVQIDRDKALEWYQKAERLESADAAAAVKRLTATKTEVISTREIARKTVTAASTVTEAEKQQATNAADVSKAILVDSRPQAPPLPKRPPPPLPPRLPSTPSINDAQPATAVSSHLQGDPKKQVTSPTPIPNLDTGEDAKLSASKFVDRERKAVLAPTSGNERPAGGNNGSGAHQSLEDVTSSETVDVKKRIALVEEAELKVKPSMSKMLLGHRLSKIVRK